MKEYEGKAKEDEGHGDLAPRLEIYSFIDK